MAKQNDKISQKACQKLHEEGKSDKEIAEIFGVKEREAWSWRRFGRATKHRIAVKKSAKK